MRGSSKALAIITLVVGIAAFLTGLIPFLGLFLAAGSIVVGIIALRKRQPLGLTITGLALGGIALITGVAVTVSLVAFLASGTAPTARDIAPSTSPDVSEPPSPEEATPEPSATPTPEEDDQQTPAPESSADGSPQNPLPQPYVAEGLFGGDNYSLTARVVDANANALVEQWNQFNSDAPTGFKYVVVELTMTGINPDGVEPSLAIFDLSLATEEGNEYDAEYVTPGEGVTSMSDGPTLYPGSTFTGITAYIVPESAISFLLFDNGNYVSL